MSKLTDMSGKQIHNIEVIEWAGMQHTPKGGSESAWKCKCLMCGNEFVLPQHRLKTHPPQDCGCTKVAPGKTFGGLQVLRKLDGIKKEQYLWECQCLHCGSVKPYYTHQIVKGRQSCGCLTLERIGSEDNLRKAHEAACKDGIELASVNRTKPQKGKKSGLPRWVKVSHITTGGIVIYMYWFQIGGKRYIKRGFTDPDEAYVQALIDRRKIYAEHGIVMDTREEKP